MNLISLQFKTTGDFQKNLDNLITLINQCKENSFILAPEVCLSEFSYDRFEEASTFSIKAIDKLLELSINKYISLTLIIKENNKFYNTAYIFYNNQIIHRQCKVKLFPLGGEMQNFTAGEQKSIKTIEINGFKVAFLICFELRFIELWQQLQGADLICIPSMWGKSRKENFETLTKALAVANQCYVLASNSTNSDMASSSGIITPFGDEYRDDDKEILSHTFDKKIVKKMRRYLDIGIK